MKILGVQIGHYPRKIGATGTAGEQAMNLSVANRIFGSAPAGWSVRLIYADPALSAYRGLDAFVALHGDGSYNKAVRGASVGHRTALGKQLATRWKAAYNAAGWPGGWHNDNYTAALGGYYGMKRAIEQGCNNAFILEVGMMTNPHDRAWIDANHAVIAESVWTAVYGARGTVVTPPVVTPPKPKPAVAPPIAWSGSPIRNTFWSRHRVDQRVLRWQRRMHVRGWRIGVDGKYGPESANVARQFQTEKHLTVDGILGHQTYDAAWTAKVT
jgi:peptidoglycan hydrolase-like protein with peptidoglycan-binding domain